MTAHRMRGMPPSRPVIKVSAGMHQRGNVVCSALRCPQEPRSARQCFFSVTSLRYFGHPHLSAGTRGPTASGLTHVCLLMSGLGAAPQSDAAVPDPSGWRAQQSAPHARYVATVHGGGEGGWLGKNLSVDPARSGRFARLANTSPKRSRTSPGETSGGSAAHTSDVR